VVLVILLPFVDRSRVRNPLHKPVTTTIALVLIIATLALTIWGWVAS
jgi:quinol-cytochrome oxidoreductase complex cytochrome b subunit